MNWASIGLGNGLSPVRRQAITSTKLAYCQLDSWEQISMKFEQEFYNFDSRKCIWKCRLPEWRPFCPGGDELTAVDVRAWMIYYITTVLLGCTHLSMATLVLSTSAPWCVLCAFSVGNTVGRLWRYFGTLHRPICVYRAGDTGAIDWLCHCPHQDKLSKTKTTNWPRYVYIGWEAYMNISVLHMF